MEKEEEQQKEEEEVVVLLDFWASTYAMRVRIALAEKGIKYESKEENLLDKSSLLLSMNPVHQKVPVLIHKGKPICESLIIISYIDEVWNNSFPKFLPSNPYERSRARFWADYIDQKLPGIGRRIFMGKGETLEKAKKEYIECLKILEAELGDRPHFGWFGAETETEGLGLVDVVLLAHSSWFYGYQMCAGFNLEDECPILSQWLSRCMRRPAVSASLPDPLRIYDYILHLKQRHGVQ